MSPECLHAAAGLLAQPGGESLLGALKPGQCLFRLAEDWTHTTAGIIDFAPPYLGTDAPAYDTHAYEPERPLDGRSDIQRALIDADKQQQASGLHARRARPSGLSKFARNLLDAWSLHPFTPLVRLWDSLDSPSFDTQLAVREELSGQKLAVIRDWRVSKMLIGLMEITLAGWELLGKPPPELRGRGEIVHRHAAHWIHRVHRKRGWHSQIEWPVPGTGHPGHPGDVACRRGDRWEVYEIVVDTDNLLHHLQACLLTSNAVASVTVVAATKKKLRQLQAQVEAEVALQPVLARVLYEPVETYYHELFHDSKT